MARKNLAEQELALRVWEAYNFTCAACGTFAMSMGNPLTYEDCTLAGLSIDHVIPTKHNGPDTQENMQCLCTVCNGKKNGTRNLARLPVRDPEINWVKVLHNRRAWFNLVNAQREFNKQDAN